MNKRTYEDYIKNDCHPVGYNEPCQSYFFSQTTVDLLLDRIDKLKQQLESREDSDSSTMKYLNKLRDENIKLKKELSRYKSYKADDERIKDLTNLYSQYAEENKKLRQELKDKDFALECKERDIKSIERQRDKAYDDYGYLDKISRELGLQNVDYEKQIAILKSSEKCLTERIRNQTLLAIQELAEVERLLYESHYKEIDGKYYAEYEDIKSLIDSRMKTLKGGNYGNIQGNATKNNGKESI